VERNPEPGFKYPHNLIDCFWPNVHRPTNIPMQKHNLLGRGNQSIIYSISQSWQQIRLYHSRNHSQIRTDDLWRNDRSKIRIFRRRLNVVSVDDKKLLAGLLQFCPNRSFGLNIQHNGTAPNELRRVLFSISGHVSPTLPRELTTSCVCWSTSHPLVGFRRTLLTCLGDVQFSHGLQTATTGWATLNGANFHFWL